MALLLDTNILIHLRDGSSVGPAAPLQPRLPPYASILSRVELESGVQRDPAAAAVRRTSTSMLLRRVKILPLDEAVVLGYGRIVAALGFSRTLVIDRLIAATAIVYGLTLATINADDFRDVPGLDLEVWPAPGQ